MPDFGSRLGLSTLAEGVETIDEMDVLRTADVHQAQGFLMARPLGKDLMDRLLDPTRTRPRPEPVQPSVED